MGSGSSTEAEIPNVTPIVDQEELVRPIKENGRYRNPFPTYEDRGFTHLMRLMKDFALNNISGIPWNNKEELDKTLPVLKPDIETLAAGEKSNNLRAVWMGHACVLVKVDDLVVLTDPVWGYKCGPLGKMGAKRYRPPPCSIDELPELDAVVISHNHYDHLEYSTVVKLNKRFGKNLHWFVAEGQAKWMRDAGCEMVTELTWWEEASLEKHGHKYTIAATPSQHWCQRTATDRDKALWASWVVQGPRHNFYFAGDTGYCFGFRQIGRKYGPFSLAAIPIGAYHPRWFMRPQHCNPEEAVEMHVDLRARRSLAIHWGTYVMTVEPYMEPKTKLADAVAARGLHEAAFTTVRHGEVLDLDSETVEDR
ncbi:N-acyl-phosphatidylethanolamine-hydrolyzing phospholipase D-like [Mya arenaria]|uniref:N-acyl-phosphatidylethanolamine-hydrolyzing phospholipase D-like n=1 Tax=Mya arenaria TaxID=6604 RepID=UPI0022E4026D|nr:N-acyl-phosphatidylethanolamine-hydrolyzing phospholipase D-like [Mya arenaria]